MKSKDEDATCSSKNIYTILPCLNKLTKLIIYGNQSENVNVVFAFEMTSV